MVWVVLGVLFAYYLYTPFPDNAKHPIKQRFSRAAVRLMHDIVSCRFKTEKNTVNDSVKKIFNVKIYINNLFHLLKHIITRYI